MFAGPKLQRLEVFTRAGMSASHGCFTAASGFAAVVGGAGGFEFDGDFDGLQGATGLIGSGKEVEMHRSTGLAERFSVQLRHVSVFDFLFRTSAFLFARSPRR